MLNYKNELLLIPHSTEQSNLFDILVQACTLERAQNSNSKLTTK